MLIAARFVQGVGGAMASAVILGMIVTMFPEPREQAKAIGVFGFVASAGASIGLLVGGVLTQSINWHWIFFVNIPIGIATAMLAVRLLEKDKGSGLGRGADFLGAVLITGALMLAVYTIVEPAADTGWASGRTLGFGAVSLALLVAFLVRESTAREPLIPLRIFRSRNVSGANAIQALFVAGMFGMFFMGALYLQRVLGYDALPDRARVPALHARDGHAVAALLRAAGHALRRPLARCCRASCSASRACVLLTLAPVDGNYAEHVLPVMVLLGAGAGISFPALMTLSMSGATPSDAGLASGLVNTTLQVGGALGLAVLATLSSTRTEDLLAAGDSTAAALNGGYHLAYLIGAGLILAALAVALPCSSPSARRRGGGRGHAEARPAPPARAGLRRGLEATCRPLPRSATLWRFRGGGAT